MSEVFRVKKKKKEGNGMLPVNSFDDCSPWADSIETISRLDIKACLFAIILYRKYSQRYNKYR